MGFKAKIQLIKRQKSEQYYVNFPSAVAQAMEFTKGDEVEWIVKSKDALTLKRVKDQEKKNNQRLLMEFEALWDKCRDTFYQDRIWKRAGSLALSMVTCLGRQTISGLICNNGKQFQDWTSDYRVFSQSKWDANKLFDVILQETRSYGSNKEPVVVAMDDTRVKKTGKKIPHTQYTRDPLSPPFHVNLIRAQRFLQLSVLIPESFGPSAARAIPITFDDVPPVPKPPFHATQEEKAKYQRRRKKENLSFHGAHALSHVRDRLDRMDNYRHLVTLVDGSFCNSNVLKHIPANTTLIGRIRGDAVLHNQPERQPEKGRKKSYGDRVIRPEELRTDPSVEWQTVSAYATGKLHAFKIKTENFLLWRKAGHTMPLRLVVIAPLLYRRTKQGARLYRKPAFLICTDPNLPVEKVVQYYVWRWDIEVNFRDEKQLMGVGKAQVRNHRSVSRAPAFSVIVYSLLMLASLKAFGIKPEEPVFPVPKWRKLAKIRRITTNQLRNNMRYDLWGHVLPPPSVHFSDFMLKKRSHTKSEKYYPSLESSIFCIYN